MILLLWWALIVFVLVAISHWLVKDGLMRSSGDAVLAGVCSGLGNFTPVHRYVWRFLFVIPLHVGIAWVWYFVLAETLPEGP